MNMENPFEQIDRRLTAIESLLHKMSMMVENKELAFKAQYLETSVKELKGLDARSLGCLWNSRIYTIGDLIEYTIDDLYRLRNCGKMSVGIIENALNNAGYQLKKL